VHDWTFLLGPNLILGVNTLLLASLMYTSDLVPRRIAQLGLVAGPIICVSAVAVLFGAYDQLSTAGTVAGLPVLAREVSLAVWLIVKGFKRSPITSADAAYVGVDAVPPPPRWLPGLLWLPGNSRRRGKWFEQLLRSAYANGPVRKRPEWEYSPK
jgi:hypothetical protein